MARFKPLQTGIELKIGEPGAGKSFIAIKRAIEVMRQQRRPVYTNLPLKWRVFRKYLKIKGGSSLAGLVRPLTEDHLNRFMVRFDAWRAFKDKARASGSVVGRQAIRVAFEAVHGPEIDQGEGANWIPPTALVIIDEAQHWYPNPALKNVRKIEPEALMSYLTMHRHLMHWVWVLTQADRQISTTIKSLIARKWVIRQRDYDKLAWGIQFRFLGIKALSYRAFRPEDNPDVDEPHETFNIFPTWPGNQIYFRLYESFTHAGSRRDLMAGLAAVRRASGLDDKGRMAFEMEAGVRKPSIISRALSASMRMGCFAVIILVVLAAGMYFGKSKGKREAVEETKVAAKAAEVVDRSARLASMSTRGVRISTGESISQGGRYGDLQLVTFNIQKGVSVWHRLGDHRDVWVWKVGGKAERIGTVQQTLDKIEQRRGGGRSGIDSSGATTRPTNGDVPQRLGSGGSTGDPRPGG